MRLMTFSAAPVDGINNCDFDERIMELNEFCTDLRLLNDPKKFTEGQMLLIDKPMEWTSFDVVNKIRSRLQNGLGIKKLKVGHSGTLDPLATGLVMVCTGKATKKINALTGYEKCYEARIKFGGTTPSFDLETEIDHTYPTEHLDSNKIEEALASFIGDQAQIPPHYSAIKINGRRAYDMVRKGVTFEMNARNVVFYEVKLLDYTDFEAHVFIRCSKGTYIRSFARDLGVVLNTGAHLSGLRRIGIGTVSVEDAMTLSQFEEQFETAVHRWKDDSLL
jgi:tRNA pseudouridine55 synthase